MATTTTTKNKLKQLHYHFDQGKETITMYVGKGTPRQTEPGKIVKMSGSENRKRDVF